MDIDKNKRSKKKEFSKSKKPHYEDHDGLNRIKYFKKHGKRGKRKTSKQFFKKWGDSIEWSDNFEQY